MAELKLVDTEMLNGGEDLPIAKDERLLPGDLERAFFQQSDILRHIYTAAESANVNATAVLFEILAVASSRIPYQVRIQHNPMQTANVTPGTFVCLVGASGTGKGRAQTVASKLLPADTYKKKEKDYVDAGKPASGEGLARLFIKQLPPVKGEPVETVRRRNVMARFSEGSEMVKAASRSGATMVPMLCSAWSGEDLSGHLARSDDSRQVEADSYSFAFAMGLQPLNAGPLFEAEATGLVQRFLFAQAGRPETPEDEIDLGGWRSLVEDPGPLEWKNLAYGDNEITICDEAAQDIYVHDQRNVKPDKYDTHKRALWIKTAGVVAALHHSTHVTPEYWEIAKTIVAASAKARESVARVLADEQAESNRRYAEAKAQEAVVARDKLEAVSYDRFATDMERVAEHITEQKEGTTTSQIYKSLWNSKTKDRKDRATTAIASLIEDERIHLKDRRYHIGKS